MGIHRLLSLRMLIPLALMAALIFVVACGSEEESTQPSATAAPDATAMPITAPEATEAPAMEEQSVEVRMSAYADAEVWEPVGSGSLSSVQAYSQLYNQIVQFDTTETTKVVCDLCTDWEVSNDGQTFTFNLVDNAVWHAADRSRR